MNATATQTYNRRYYIDNRGKLLLQRRDRYANDPIYRRRMKRLARDNYAKRTEGQVKQVVRPGVMRTPDGSILYTVGVAAKASNRKVQTIRKYHRSGVIPNPLFYDKRGWRLYTKEQILLLRTVFQALDDGRIKRADAISVLGRRWSDG